MNNTQRQYSKVAGGGDKLLQKRIRSNLPHKNLADKENTQKNLQKTNPRMASARANPRQDKQVMKNQEMLQQQFTQQMLYPPQAQMGAMMPGFGMPQPQYMMQQMQAPVGLDVQNQIVDLQQRISQLSQLTQLQAQLGQLQNQAQFYPQYPMPQQQLVAQGDQAYIANQIQYHDAQQPEGSKKSSPQKPSASKKNKKDKVPQQKTSERQSSPDNEKQAKRIDPVVLQAENLPVARTTRSGRPIENSPVKNAKSAGIAAPKCTAAGKVEKKLTTQPNSQATQGTIGTLRSSNRTPVRTEIQNEQKKVTKPIQKSTATIKANKHQKVEGNDGIVRRSTRFSGVKEDFIALEDVFGAKGSSPAPLKKSAQTKSKYMEDSSDTLQDRSDTSSNLPVRRSIRHRVSPPKDQPVRETRQSNRATKDSQKTTPIQSQIGNKNEDSAILQQLKSQLIEREMEYSSKQAAQIARDQKKQEKRNNSSETRKQKAKQQYRPPTEDEMMLFGDVLLKKDKQVSEFDTKNPLETGGQQKFEAQTEIIMKNEKLIQDQEFTDDEDDLALRTQIEKEKEILKQTQIVDEGKVQDMGLLFGMKENEVQQFAQKQQQTLQTLKDESMLFGEQPKAEIFAQQLSQSQTAKNNISIKNEQQNSETILLTEDNSRSANVLNLNSQNDQEMKNENKSQEPDENTVSDHEETPDKLPEQQNKISEIDRQIAEIKKAIAIQEEITNRKLNEQAQREQEEQQAAADLAAAQLEAEAAEAAAREENERIQREHEAREAERQMEEKKAAEAEAERLRQEQLEAERKAAEEAAAERARLEQVRREQEYQKQQELIRLKYEREQQLKQAEELRRQQEAAALAAEEKQKAEIAEQKRQQELLQAQAQAEAEEKRKQEELVQYQNRLIEERNKIEEQATRVRLQLEEERRKKLEKQEKQAHIEKLHQQAIEAKRELAEEQRKKAERERLQREQREHEIEKQKEMEERARLMQIAENPSTEQHQIEIISDSDMQEESDLQYGYANSHVSLSEELIQQLPLCEEYELLLKFQKAIDQSIGFNLQRQNVTSLSTTKSYIEQTLKRDFKQSHFQKILTVAPEYYNHKWEMKFDKIELMINVPRNAAEINQYGANPSPESYTGAIPSNLQLQRSKIFKMKLVQIMIDHFQDFKHRNPQLQNFNIHNTHKWPSSFDIEDKSLVREIGLTQLKELPKTRAKQSVNDFIGTHDHNQKYQQIAKEAQEKDQEMRQHEQQNILEHDSERDSSEDDRIKGEKLQNKHGFSQATMDAIQFKQSIESEKRQKSQEIIDSQSQQSTQNLLIKASDQIKQIFTCQQGSTMFLVKLQQSMMDQHRGNFVSKDHVKELIVQLTKIVPEWITIKSNQNGTLVKCHKSLNLSHYNIRSKIEEYFRNDNGERHSKSKIETNSQDQRLSKSCPPLSSINNQKQSQGSNSGFKSFSAFTPFQKKGSINNNEADSMRKNENVQIESRNSSSINKNNFGINQGNSSISISGQQFNREYPNSNLQYQTAQIQPSSSGTYLSGPSGLSGGEAEHIPNTTYPSHTNQDIQMSRYLSPLKHQMNDQRISVSSAVNNVLDRRSNDFGHDMQQNSYEQNRYQSSQSYGRSTSMPHQYMS